ncbi:MAG: DUF4416 family protein [Pirellulales bacterium]|nr:DUF4416 family protein [Pirellulales bacterium]
MGIVIQPKPALLLFTAFSRYREALDWARGQAAGLWGPVLLESPLYRFDQTEYYTPTMGPDLWKQFFALGQLIDPGSLAAVKWQTNRWELEYAAVANHHKPRPLNLDPGYITPAKLVLASTKDHAHRIYLQDGIYAEVTLGYAHGSWHFFEWTFPDYRQVAYHEFFTRCRECLIEHLRKKTKDSPESPSK